MAFSTFSSGIRFRDRNLRRGKNGGKRFFLFFLSIIRRKEKGDPAFRNFRAITGDDYFRSSRIIKRHSPQPDFSKAAWKKNACPFSIVNRRAVTTRPFLFLEPCDFALVISKLLIGNKFDTIFLSRPISFIPGNANWTSFFFLRKNTYIFIIYTLPSYFIFFSFIKFVSIREIILKQARVDFFDFPFILKRKFSRAERVPLRDFIESLSDAEKSLIVERKKEEHHVFTSRDGYWKIATRSNSVLRIQSN